jgi:hypothetical protein
MFKVRRPFQSRTQLSGFLFALMLALLAPNILSAVLHPSAADTYCSVPPRYLNYRFLADQIAAGDRIDVVVLGSSGAWTGFDVHALAEETSKRLGRRVRVANFASDWHGFDNSYAKLIRLLPAVRPRLVLLAEEDNLVPGADGEGIPHQISKYWWSADIPIPLGLSIRERAVLFATSVLGAPYGVWASTKSCATFRAEEWWLGRSRDMSASNGFEGQRRGFLSSKDTDESRRLPYVEINSTPPDIPVEELFYPDHDNAVFIRAKPDYSPYQSSFLLAMDDAAGAAGAKLISVTMPSNVKDMNDRVPVRRLAGGVEKPWPVIGVTAAEVWPNQSVDQILAYYKDEYHLNASGAHAFSLAISPAIAKLLNDAK